MTLPEIAFKTHGIALELQVGSRVLYVNPYEEYADRRPADADAIVSFLPAAVQAKHVRGTTLGLLGGIETYTKPESRLFVDRRLRAEFQRMATSESAAKRLLPACNPISGQLVECSEAAVKGEEFVVNGATVAVRLTIEDLTFDYLPLLSSDNEAFLEREATCTILALNDWWMADIEVLRKIIAAGRSRYYFIGSSSFRKRDLQALKAQLPTDAANRIVCKKAKWLYPGRAEP